MKTLIKNGTLITDGNRLKGDLLVYGDKIAQAGGSISADGARVIDADGMLVFPGFIDAHTHLDMDTGSTVTADNFPTGTMSAVAGGTTTIIDFATQARGGTLGDALETWKKNAAESNCNYGFHMAITDWNNSVKAEMAEMAAEGVTSFKVYMAYDNLRLDDGDIFEIIQTAGQLGGIVGCHCENGDLVNKLVAEQLAMGNTGPEAHPLSRPDWLEAEAITRFVTIGHMAGYPVNIVHLSSDAGLDAAKACRQNGMKLYLETCPQYLLLDDSLYSLPDFQGAKYVISPPLRKKNYMSTLWYAIKRGDIDTIATDHCSFNFSGQKDAGKGDFSRIPNGAPGLQTRPVLMYTHGVAEGAIDDINFARLLSENPAKLYGMYPQKGSLRPGSDADIVVWDCAATGEITAATQLSACDYTPYEGMATVGAAKHVLVNGSLVVEDGKFIMNKQGRYVSRGHSQFWR